jgi:precorrin-6B methylase 2
MRRWVRLAEVVQTGRPVERRPSIRGEAGDEAAFIGAMEVVSAPVAPGIIDELGPPDFSHLLDVGGASGTWTIAFLRANPRATATVFDLPHVIPMAEERLSETQMSGRVRLLAGDFLADPLPTGADLAWVSAIVHQNSREQNRHLFSSVADALEENGQILIRDVLMDRSRTSPASGALFAINMLVATEGGGTFTFDELREDLEAAGFADVDLLRRDEWMNSIIRAVKRPRA